MQVKRILHRNRVRDIILLIPATGLGCELSDRADNGIGLRPPGKRARIWIRPGIHDPEKEIVCMSAFLLIFGLTVLLIFGGMIGSLRLRTHRMSTRIGLRRSYTAPNGANSSLAENEMARYSRKAFVITILILVILSVIIIHAVGTSIH